MKQWSVVISGFTQNRSRESGSEILWRKLQAYADHEHYVEVRKWKSNWKRVALFIHRNLDEDGIINIYAYSWGAGWGFRKLERELKKLGRRVHVAVLCDPVYRNPWMPSWLPLNPISMTLIPRISVVNTDHVFWLYQRLNYPRGHAPKTKDPSINIHRGILINVVHVDADKSLRYHNLCLEITNANDSDIASLHPDGLLDART